MSQGRSGCSFVGAGLVGLLVSSVAFVSLVNRVGRGECTEKLVPMMFPFKMECLHRSKSPRFVIMSGSNAHHTIDCEELAKAIDRDVVCAGLLYAMPVRFYEPILEDVLQSGDVLYLPLENWHYHMSHDQLTSPFAVSFLWGVYPRALRSFTPRELVSLYCRKGLAWIQNVLPKRLKGEIPVLPPHHMYNIVRQHPGADFIGGFRLRGDSISNLSTSMDPQSALDMPTQFSDEFRIAFGRLLDLAKRRGVRVILGRTVCYSYSREKDLPVFENLLRELNLPVCGNPAALCLPYCCFSDYNLHCNAAGKRLFTHEITRDICRVLGKPFAEQDGWPLVTFAADAGNILRFPQGVECVGKPAFGEFILGRRESRETNVVEKVLVDGNPVRFEERSFAAKNMLWVWWSSPRKNISVEIVPKGGCACRVERVLMEPDPSAEIAKISAFNDVSSDFEAKGAGRFVCKAKNGKDAYLRVRIPNWKSNRYRLHFTLRGGAFLKKVKVGGLPECRRDLGALEIAGDEIHVCVALNESQGFVAEDGCAYAGVFFPQATLSVGDEIIVADLSFEML